MRSSILFCKQLPTYAVYLTKDSAANVSGQVFYLSYVQQLLIVYVAPSFILPLNNFFLIENKRISVVSIQLSALTKTDLFHHQIIDTPAL